MSAVDPGELMLMTGFGFYPTASSGRIVWVLPNTQGTHAVAAVSRYSSSSWCAYYYSTTSGRIDTAGGDSLQDVMRQFSTLPVARTAVIENSAIHRYPPAIPPKDRDDDDTSPRLDD